MGYSKHITYNTLGSLVSLFCQWLIMMLIPKMTDFSDAGIFAIALSICSILNIFATLSLNQYQIADQHVRFSENDYRTSRIITIIFSFALCIPVTLFMGYSTEQNLVIVAYMIYRNILHFAYLYTATLQIRDHLDYAGKCTALEGVVSLITFLVAFNYTSDLVISVALMAAIGGGFFLFTVIAGYKKYVGKTISVSKSDPKAIKRMIWLGIPLLFSGVAPIIITALPKIMLQMYWGDVLVGIFSTLSAPTIVVPTLIMGVFTPFIVHFSNVSRSGNMRSLRMSYGKMVAAVLLFGALGLVLSVFFGKYFFILLYGDEIIPYVHYFNILVIGIVLYSLGMCGITVMITKEQGRAAAILSVIALVISTFLFAFTIPYSGIDGASYGLLLAYGIFGLLISLGVLFIPLKKTIVVEQ